MSTETERLPLIELPAGAQQRGLGILEVTKDSKRIALPLSGVDISARVADRVASVTVKETFRNTYTEHLEAVYIFPLSGGCAVSNFELRVGNRVIKGQVEERGQARKQYEQAIEGGKRAALLEQERDDVFTVQVGNLPPGEEVCVLLTYSERLPFFEDGKTEIRLPLVVAPRYIPGKALDRQPVGCGTEADTNSVPDASRITPPRLANGFNPNVNLKVTVELMQESAQSNHSISDLSCSQHATRLCLASGSVKVELSRADERLNRDFVLRWRLTEKAVKSSLLVHREADGTAYAMLSLLPPKREGYLGAPRDVVFVLDRSGSMGGIKMTSAARSCSILLSTLGPSDRFAIEAFDNVSEWLLPAGSSSRNKDYFHTADEPGIERGEKFLRGIDARGGTELDKALADALQAINNRSDKDGRVPVLVVLTDGEVGDESRILKRVQNQLGDSRLFCVGIDTAVNDGLLRRVANLGGGTATFVEPGAELEEALLSVGRDIGNPLVVDLEIEGAHQAGIDKSSLAPARIPDLFAGRAVTAFFKLSGKGSLTVKGRMPDGTIFSEKVKVTEVELPAIAQLWAKSHIADLEDSFRVQPHAQNELKRKIIDLSVKHSLLTRFTAFVVVDESEVVNVDGTVRKIVQPVENPAAWDMLADAQNAAGAWGAPAQASLPGAYGSPYRIMSLECRSLLRTEADDASGESLGKFKSLKGSAGNGGSSSPSATPGRGNAPPPSGSWGSITPARDSWGAPANEIAEGEDIDSLADKSIDAIFSEGLSASAEYDPNLRQDDLAFEKKASQEPAPKPSEAAGMPLNQPCPTPPAPAMPSAPATPPPATNTGKGAPGSLASKIKEALLGAGKPNSDMGQPGSQAKAGRARQSAEELAVAKALKELSSALSCALAEIKAGKVPGAAELEKLRKTLLAALNRCDLGTKVPSLQKFLRSAAVELIASLKDKDVTAAGLAPLFERHMQAFAEAQAQATTLLEGTATSSDGSDPFWESTV